MGKYVNHITDPEAYYFSNRTLYSLHGTTEMLIRTLNDLKGTIGTVNNWNSWNALISISKFAFLETLSIFLDHLS
jgi:hypothetical protein